MCPLYCLDEPVWFGVNMKMYGKEFQVLLGNNAQPAYPGGTEKAEGFERALALLYFVFILI